MVVCLDSANICGHPPARSLQICYDATPDPKMVVHDGTDAISGGIFEGSPTLDRSFLDNHKVDLYIAGNPSHPLTVIDGLLALTGREREDLETGHLR